MNSRKTMHRTMLIMTVFTLLILLTSASAQTTPTPAPNSPAEQTIQAFVDGWFTETAVANIAATATANAPTVTPTATNTPRPSATPIPIEEVTEPLRVEFNQDFDEGTGWAEGEVGGLRFQWMTQTRSTLDVPLSEQGYIFTVRVIGANDFSLLDNIAISLNDDLIELAPEPEFNDSVFGQPAIRFRGNIERETVEKANGRRSELAFEVPSLAEDFGLALDFVQFVPDVELPETACSIYQDNLMPTVEDICQGTRRNELCYGNPAIDAEAQNDVSDFDFSVPGDRTSILDLASLRLGALDTGLDTWGVAKLTVQAGRTQSSDDVDLLIFGDIDLVNDAPLFEGGIDAVVTTPITGLNLRTNPNIDADSILVLQPGDVITVVDGPVDSGGIRWWEAITAGGRRGWVAGSENIGNEINIAFRELGLLAPGGRAIVYTTEGDNLNVRDAPSINGVRVNRLPTGTEVRILDGPVEADGFRWWRVSGSGETSEVGWSVDFADNLPALIVPVEGPRFGPLQAFTFQGRGGDTCTDFNDTGLLVQTPRGVGRVSLLVNEVSIDLGSTAYLQAEANGNLRVDVIEGSAAVSAAGVTAFVPAGGFTRVPLDDEAHAAGPPETTGPYDPRDVASLPLAYLPRFVTYAADYSPAPIMQSVIPPAGGRIPAVGEPFEGRIAFQNPDGDNISEYILNVVSSPDGFRLRNVNRLLDVTLLEGTLQEGVIALRFTCFSSADGDLVFDVQVADEGGNLSDPIRTTFQCVEP